MYAFLGSWSAIEAIRFVSSRESFTGFRNVWPQEIRLLPGSERCVHNQRSFKEFAKGIDLGLFGVTTRPVDMTIRDAGRFSRGSSARFHIWSRPLPPGSMIRLESNLLASGPELAIMQICGSHAKLEPLLDQNVEAYRAEKNLYREFGIDANPPIDDPLRWEETLRLIRAAAVVCEFSGTYRLPAGSMGDMARRRPKLMSCESLRSMAGSFTKTSLEGRTIRAANMAFDGSASPMETSLALLLTLPVDVGGFGLPRPELNHSIDVGEHRGILSDRNGVAPDMLWEKQKVAVEYDSSEQHGAGSSQLTEDALRANILSSIGYHVLRVTPGTISTLGRFELFARQTAHLIGHDLAAPTDLQRLRRSRLFAELMPSRK